MFYQTQAIIITPKNYPLVVAFLPEGFRLVPMASVFGHVLVINDIILKCDNRKHNPKRTKSSLGNCWMSREDFDDRYTLLHGEKLRKKKFASVVQTSEAF